MCVVKKKIKINDLKLPAEVSCAIHTRLFCIKNFTPFPLNKRGNDIADLVLCIGVCGEWWREDRSSDAQRRNYNLHSLILLFSQRVSIPVPIPIFDVHILIVLVKYWTLV